MFYFLSSPLIIVFIIMIITTLSDEKHTSRIRNAIVTLRTTPLRHFIWIWLSGSTIRYSEKKNHKTQLGAASEHERRRLVTDFIMEAIVLDIIRPSSRSRRLRQNIQFARNMKNAYASFFFFFIVIFNFFPIFIQSDLRRLYVRIF